MPMQRTRRSRSLKQVSRRKSYMNTANKVVSALNTGVRFRNLAKGARNAYKRYKSSGSLTKAILGSGSGGDYTQFSTASLKSGRKKRVNLPSLVKEVRARNETTIFRFQGIKEFDNWGNYWMSKFNTVDNNYMPMYCYDLTSINNSGRTGPVQAQPFGRFYVEGTTGVVKFNQVFGQTPAGVGDLGLQVEKSASTSSTLEFPHNKSRLLWNQVSMNLWGAKQKAVKYTVQIVKLDSTLDPWEMGSLISGTNDYQKCQAFYQSLIKPLTYNPIATTSTNLQKYMKVLKTYTTVIQPTSSTENDADPHAKILKWFMRWDRDFNYEHSAKTITGTELFNEPDFAQQRQENTAYTSSSQKIFLLVRATCYSLTTTEESTVSGSFDICVRSCHVPQ